MWLSGSITADALYWKEGETDWKEVACLLAPNSVTEPEFVSQSTGKISPVSKSPRIPLDQPALGDLVESTVEAHKHQAQPVDVTFSKTPNDLAPRPWRRLCVRLLDGTLSGIVLAPISILIWRHTDSYLGASLTMTVVSVPCFAMIEGGLLSLTGSTISKALLGLRVSRANGERLGFDEAVRSYFSIWWRRLLVIPCFIAYSELKRLHSTKWDRKGNFIVSSATLNPWRWMAFSFALITATLIQMYVCRPVTDRAAQFAADFWKGFAETQSTSAGSGLGSASTSISNDSALATIPERTPMQSSVSAAQPDLRATIRQPAELPPEDVALVQGLSIKDTSGILNIENNSKWKLESVDFVVTVVDAADRRSIQAYRWHATVRDNESWKPSQMGELFFQPFDSADWTRRLGFTSPQVSWQIVSATGVAP